MENKAIKPGDFILSLAGRDRGKVMVVLTAADGFFYCADGKERRIEAPKKKKSKHILPLDVPQYNGKTSNRELRNAIKALTDDVK